MCTDVVSRLIQNTAQRKARILRYLGLLIHWLIFLFLLLPVSSLLVLPAALMVASLPGSAPAPLGFFLLLFAGSPLSLLLAAKWGLGPSFSSLSIRSPTLPTCPVCQYYENSKKVLLFHFIIKYRYHTEQIESIEFRIV